MHKPYPTTPYRLPLQALHAIPSPQIGKRISLLALQEELQLPTRQDFPMQTTDVEQRARSHR